MSPKIAQVVLGLPIEGPFDYSVPESMRHQVAEGQRVKVPFHHSSRVGYIIGLKARSPYKQLKEITTLIDSIPIIGPQMLKLTKEFAQYYACSWGEAIEASLPSALRRTRKVKISKSVFKTPNKTKEQHLLLHGSDQQWPVLIEHIKKILQQGGGVIFLVPEVHMIEGIKQRLQKDFVGECAVLDKQLKDKEELQQWLRLKAGETQLVIGTRSAIFAPVQKLSLIVIFDEENRSYKQEQSPFYHVREVALMRAKAEGANVIWISSAPSVETWHLAKVKKYKVLSYDKDKASDMQMVDMTNYNPKKSSILSVPLRQRLEKALTERRQVVLFMNRKGFATRTLCQKCGYILKCERCDVNLTYLYTKKKMVCRLCNSGMKVPRICPQCQNTYLHSSGLGIEKLESELSRVFPQAKIGHYDRDTQVDVRKTDILIATQAVLRLKGRLSPSFIAVLYVDGELNRLDVRSSHNVFALLVHLRELAQDQLVVQTRMPDNDCLKAAQKMNFSQFYRQELKLRKELDFPPYTHMIALGLRGPKEEVVFEEVSALYEMLKSDPPKDIEILEPHPDVIPKLRDKYRFTIIVKGKSVKSALAFIKRTLKNFKRKSRITLTINVDP